MPTKIQKLSIRGIRSFSPDDSAAVIEFYSPLTVILGMNGTGKTTIIECLKYSTTGDLPPNAQRNGSFINGNMGSKRKGEVKAQVKLLFSTSSPDCQQEHVVIRSLQATYSSTTTNTVKQKTLESVLITRDSLTGQQESVSRKCSEFDSILPCLFQVSRAVLDNVIFCHQEDSLWPLSESSVLKKKFDDLFESVKYSSLLKTVKDSTKKQLDLLKLEQQHLLFLQKDREKSVKVEQSFTVIEQRIEELQYLTKELDKELFELLKRNEECMEEYQSMGMLENELKLREKEMEMLKDNYETKKLRLEEDQDEDLQQEDEEIIKKIKLFTQKRDSLKDKVDLLHKERLDLDRELSDCNSELTLLMVEKSKLLQKRESLKEKIEQKQQHLIGVQSGDSNAVNIITQSYSSPSQNGDSDALSVLDETLLKIEMEIEMKKKELHQKQRHIEQKIMSHRMVVKEYEDSMGKFRKEKNGNQEKIVVLRNELKNVVVVVVVGSSDSKGVLESKRKEYEEELAGIEKEKKEQEDEANEKSFKELQYNEKKHLLESQLQSLRKELLVVQENQELMLKLDYKQKEIDSRHKEKQKYMKMIQDEIALNQFEINSNNSDNGKDLSAIMVLQHHEQLQEKHLELLQKSSEFDRDLAICSAQLQEEKLKLKELKQKEKQCCNFLKSKYKQTDLTLLQQELEQQITQEEDSMLYRNNQKLYDELLQKSLKDGVCFVCGGTEGIDKDSLKQRHQKEIKSTLTSTSMDIDTLRQRKKEMDKYVMLYEEPLKKLLKVELPECESKIEALDRRYEELNAKCEEAAADIVNSKVSLDALEQILKLSDDVKRIERDLKAKEGELEGLKSRLGSFSDGSSKTAGEVNLEIQRITEELQQLRNDWDLQLSEYNRKQNELLKRQAFLREMEMEIMQLTRNEEECKRLNAQLEELQEAQQRIAKEMEQLEQKIRGQEGTADLEQELSEITACYEAELKQLQQEHSEKLSVKNKLLELNREICKLSAETQNDKYSDVCKKIEELQIQVAGIQKRVQELSSLESFNQEFTRIVSTINNLNTLLQVKSAHAELKLKEEEVQQMKDSFSNQFEQLEHYKRMLNDLKREQSQKTVELATLQGELKQLLLQKQNIVNELETDYKDIDEKYKKQMIKVETLRLAAKDLDRCKQTFEGALLKYHSLKMEHLNKIIGELWRKTYKGNDIDSVEIRSETEAKAGSRSYSYRVVMIKGSDEMDMRGRSSAGQKVLASIIIRLALAETFGAKCGILALDEPTTNLDEANICSLAESLAEVIKERRKQSNFQLILITHDEQFLQKIGLSNYTDYIYKVSKNHEQYSTITRIPVNEN